MDSHGFPMDSLLCPSISGHRTQWSSLWCRSCNNLRQPKSRHDKTCDDMCYVMYFSLFGIQERFIQEAFCFRWQFEKHFSEWLCGLRLKFLVFVVVICMFNHQHLFSTLRVRSALVWCSVLWKRLVGGGVRLDGLPSDAGVHFIPSGGQQHPVTWNVGVWWHWRCARERDGEWEFIEINPSCSDLRLSFLGRFIWDCFLAILCVAKLLIMPGLMVVIVFWSRWLPFRLPANPSAFFLGVTSSECHPLLKDARLRIYIHQNWSFNFEGSKCDGQTWWLKANIPII